MGVMVAEGGAIGDSDGSTIVKIPRSNCIGAMGKHFTPNVT
ncbi:hypothetical protein [Methanococcoides seepicolus]|nr:hypothetical protein [Methanococcoides seepicolus]